MGRASMRLTGLIEHYASEARALISALRTHAPLARQDSGKSLWSQALEMIRLRKGAGRLDPDEYYQYCLYDDRRFTWEQKQEFLGRRMENGLIPILREEPWIGLANDKVVAYAFLRGLGFPIPEPLAVYHSWRACGDIPVLDSKPALAGFVRTVGQPFVAKPVYGMWGRNVTAVREYDRNGDCVRLANGTLIAVDALVDRLDSVQDKGGLLLQERLTPHPAIRERCGDRICSLRLVTIVDQHGPRLVSAVWKVATGGAMADNYWEPGNLVAHIDPDTGVVGRTFTGLGRNIRHVDTHPDTGERLSGFTLPDWPAARTLCLRATASIPKLAMQAWDVALTGRGPVLLEVNVNGGMRLPQLCANAGLLRGEFEAFLNRFGYPPPRRRRRAHVVIEPQHAHANR